MKISLFQGIFIGVFGIAALLGLFVFATYSNTGGSGAVGTVVIWGTLPADGINTTLTTATRSVQQLKNVTYVQKDPATITADLASAIATGNPPDLVLASQEELLALARFITPIPIATLSARTFTSTFIEEGQLLTAPNNAGYYGVPFLVDPLVLFSNNIILASSGVASPPSTWESLTGLVPKIALLTPSRQITRGLIALGTYDNVHNALGILSSLFFQTGVSMSSRSALGVLSADLGETTSGGVPAGQAVLGFYTQFADPSKVSYTWNASLPDSQRAFLSGDLALYLGYASEARYFQAANPNLNFDASPLPQPATAAGKSAYARLYSLMIPHGARNSSGAYQAAVLLTGDAVVQAAAASTGLAPASRSALSSPPADPIGAVAYEEALYAKGWLSPLPALVNPILSGMIGNVISGRSTLATALATASRSLSALLQQ